MGCRDARPLGNCSTCASSCLKIDYTNPGHQWWNIKQVWLSSKSCIKKSAQECLWIQLTPCIALYGSWAQNRVGTGCGFLLKWDERGLIGLGPAEIHHLKKHLMAIMKYCQRGSIIHFRSLSSRMQHMVADKNQYTAGMSPIIRGKLQGSHLSPSLVFPWFNPPVHITWIKTKPRIHVGWSPKNPLPGYPFPFPFLETYVFFIKTWRPS